jgi:GWxTD domain-containing protein
MVAVLRSSLVRLVAALVVCGAATPALAQAQAVRLVPVRFWRSADSTSLVEGMIGVQVVAKGDSVPAPTVGLTVRDAKNNVLHEETWQQDVSKDLAGVVRGRPAGAEVTSSFAVALQRGAYSVVVRSRNANGADSVSVPVQAFEKQPLLSDMLLSPAIRVLGPNDDASSGELRRAAYAILRTPNLKLTPSNAGLWYYLEAYAPAGPVPDSAQLNFAVVSADGSRTLFKTSRSFLLRAPGRPDVGKLDMTGLPPGDYKLVVDGKSGTREDHREAGFAMGSLADEPAPPVATAAESAAQARRSAAENATMEKYFAPGVIPDSQVVTLVDAMTLAAPGERVLPVAAKLSPDAKRRFLAAYWSRNDPTPGTPKNELLEEYMGRVEYANKNFSERDIKRPGVRTDRGRIYLKWGAPDDRQNRPMSGKGGVDMWKYTHQRNLKYIFLDKNGFEHYNLILTNDPNEQSAPDWSTLVGDQEMVTLITSF